MPPSSPDVSSFDADLARCREALRVGSRSFFAASRLLPSSVRDSATILYAFCREADDAVDVSGGGLHALAVLRERLDQIYAGTPQANATDRALAVVVAQHALPRILLDALIEGFQWDVEGRSYETLEDLHAYAARVAGTIGAMMAVLMGVRDPDALARACELGVAMQLTNIARDVGDDARAGRLYLPQEWLRDAGVDPCALLTESQIGEPVRAMIRSLLDVADLLYDRVGAGVAVLPSSCRAGINAARYIYSEIGQEIRRAGFDSVSRRAVVPGSRKLWLLIRAFVPVSARRSESASPATLQATRFLVDAVVESRSAPAGPIEVPNTELSWWKFRSQALWLIDLFERMERRDRLNSMPEPSRYLAGS